MSGLSEDLFNRLSSSPALPFLGCVTELFVNFQGMLPYPGVWFNLTALYVAIEHQVFSLQEPELFFSMYSPPRSQAEFKPAQDRLLEDIRFASKIVRSFSRF